AKFSGRAWHRGFVPHGAGKSLRPCGVDDLKPEDSVALEPPPEFLPMSPASKLSRRSLAARSAAVALALTLGTPGPAFGLEASGDSSFFSRLQSEMGSLPLGLGGNSTEGSAQSNLLQSLGLDSGAGGWVAGLALVFVVLVPLLKVGVSGAAAVFLAGNIEDKPEDEEEDFLQKVVRVVNGDPPDALDQGGLKVTRLNDELVALQAAVAQQTLGQSAAEALREKARKGRFLAAWHGTVLGLGMDDLQSKAVDAAVGVFREKETQRQLEYQELRSSWLRSLAKKEVLASAWSQYWLKSNMGKELEYQDELLGVLTNQIPKRSLPRLKELFEKRVDPGWLADSSAEPGLAQIGRRRVYVLNFDGDGAASQTAGLAREIDAILAMPQKPEEVVLILQSPGGAVTGYGLAGAELMRLRVEGVRLVVCVDQLAASGGYLMACCADQIFCSPFAAIGSIGVVSQTPNAAEFLERQGVKFIQTTAGRWKTTVTPFTKPTPEQLAKVKEDLTLVYDQFTSWVKMNRQDITVSEVATGEVWYGPNALERGLVDGLQTSGEYLLQCMTTRNCEVFALSSGPPKGGLAGALGAAAAQAFGAANGSAGLGATGAVELVKRTLGGAGGGAMTASLLQALLQQGVASDGNLTAAGAAEALAAAVAAEVRSGSGPTLGDRWPLQGSGSEAFRADSSGWPRL
ncbi:unnamed protein product, partial [Polarella glacialis]